VSHLLFANTTGTKHETISRCRFVGQPGYYFGPRYYWDSNSGRPIAVAADGSTRSIGNARITSAGSLEGITSRAGSFARGGFGSSAHGFSGG
jgi:hypothetical protein